MIVPRNRLIYWTGLIAIPSALLIAVDPSLAWAAAVIFCIFLLLVVADAVSALGRLDGVSASLPEIVRLTRDREGEINIEIKTDPPIIRQLRLGLKLPAEITSADEDVLASFWVGVVE